MKSAVSDGGPSQTSASRTLPESTGSWDGTGSSLSANESSRAPASVQASKPEVLARLRQLQIRQVQEITTLEESVRKLLKDSTALSLREEPNLSNGKLARLNENLTSIDQRRAELLARREVVDQLILLIDSKWDGKGLQTFLEHSLLDIANGDLTNTQGSGDTWRFMTYLSIAVREVPEPREDILGVVESYMNFANVLNPRSPAEFMASRNYTNGSESVTARSARRDSVGDEIDKIENVGQVNKVGKSVSPVRALRSSDDFSNGSVSGSSTGASAIAAPRAGAGRVPPASPAATRPGAASSAPSGVGRELDLRVRKSPPERPEPEARHDAEPARSETPSMKELSTEPIYISPRLKAAN